MKIKDGLRKNIVKTIPRLLTQLDRDPLSPTFGCFDRNFWHYKIRDFPSFVLQQNTLTLTLLYKNNFLGNFCYRDKKILSHIKGSLDFWCQYQHRSGGFDEYWPREDSFPPLVFSFFAVAKSYRELDLPDEKIILHLDKAYQKWLKHKELEANNQEIAGLAAVYEYYLIKKEPKVLKRFNERLANLLSRQSEEGWFSEYGGADIGYSSVSLHYLTHLYKLTKRDDILSSINKLVNFLADFIHPDGSCGGEYGSRNTEYFLLGGLPLIIKKNNKALKILGRLDKGIEKLDDRYLFHYIFLSYLTAFLDLRDFNTSKKISTGRKNFSNYFNESGLFVKKKNELYFIANLKKGGTYKVFFKGKLKANDCGYRVFDRANNYRVTSWIDNDAKIVISKDGLTAQSALFKNKFFIASSLKHMGLRILTFIFGSKVIPVLKNRLIFQDERTEDKLARMIKFRKNKIIIEDTLRLADKQLIYKVYEGSMRFVPSSNFFSEGLSVIPMMEKMGKKKLLKQRKIINLD